MKGKCGVTTVYRRAEICDLAEITVLVKDVIENMCSKGIFQWDDVYPTEEDFKQDILQGNLTIVLIGEKIAAVYVLNDKCDEQYLNGEWITDGSSYRVIHRLCVNTCFQNRGIAKEILNHIENNMRLENVKSIRLDVFSQNVYALKLYEKRGYIKVGETVWRKGIFFLMEKEL